MVLCSDLLFRASTLSPSFWESQLLTAQLCRSLGMALRYRELLHSGVHTHFPPLPRNQAVANECLMSEYKHTAHSPQFTTILKGYPSSTAPCSIVWGLSCNCITSKFSRCPILSSLTFADDFFSVNLLYTTLHLCSSETHFKTIREPHAACCSAVWSGGKTTTIRAFSLFPFIFLFIFRVSLWTHGFLFI